MTLVQDQILEQLRVIASFISIPDDTSLYLTGSLINPNKIFREESDIDLWLISDIPDVIEENDDFTTMIQSVVSMSSYEIEKQLPSEIMGHNIHILIPYFHPIPFKLPEYSIALQTKKGE